MYALEAKHLSKSYRTRKQEVAVLLDVSLQVRKGEMAAIMGPSGSGKTTLLHNLSGIDRPDSGQILVDGQDLSAFSLEGLARFRRKHFGMAFQDFQLLESLTVEENILLPMILDRQSPSKQARQLKKVLELTGIGDFRDRGITELSGGQKQRVAIARALIQEPDLIFADEPTGSLDAEAAENILCCMQDINRQAQASILLVTHDAHAASFCHRILYLEHGELSGPKAPACRRDRARKGGQG